MKLITENIEDFEYLTEDNNGVRNHYIKGIFLQSGIKNKNGRVYPTEILENEVNNYKSNYIDKKRAWGELSHPSGPQINLDRISHIITELTKSGNDFIGKAKLTETPMGNIAKGLLNSGGSLGVSSRGMGSLKRTDEGIMTVQPDYKIVTAADIVSDPSAPGAFVTGIMENVEWFYDNKTNNWISEMAEETKTHIKTLSTKELEEQMLGIFETFLSNIRG